MPTVTLADLLKDSAYKLSQFNAEQIQALESNITVEETRGKLTPYVICLVRKKRGHHRKRIIKGAKKIRAHKSARTFLDL